MISRRHVAVFALALCGSFAACQRVPLLAPSGSTITLTATTTAVPFNATAQITAQVIEPAGTPPQSGTHVSFTTTLGTIEPADAETDVDGRAVVTFKAGTASGTASISALSGGANVGANGALKIAVGAAAVGRVVLSANPTTVSSLGGTSTIVASVSDINGNSLPSVPVTFTTTGGTLSASLVSSDSSGNAATTLTTSIQATVTATTGTAPGASTGTGTGTGTGSGTGTGTGTSGSTSSQSSASVTVNVSAIPTVTITPQSGTLNAGSPVTFTIAVTPTTGATTQIRDVKIDFGDGSIEDLGAVTGSGLSVQHLYKNTSVQTYTVRVTVTDSLNFTTSAATVVVVQPAVPLTITITKSSTPSGTNTIYTLTATVTPSTAIVSNYTWIADGTTTLQSNASNQLIVTFPSGQVHQITVTATTSSGNAEGSVVVP